MKKSPLKRKTAAVLGVALMVVSGQLMAADITWNSAVSDGLFSNGANWVGGVAPSSIDRAIFANTGSLNVEFNSDANIANFNYDGSGSTGNPAVLTLDLGGRVLDVNGHVIMLSNAGKGVRTIVVDNGTFSMQQLQIGNSSSGTISSQMRVQNGGVLTPRSSVRIGGDRPGELFIETGAKFTTQHRVSLGYSASGSGSVSISGTNSKWTTAGASVSNVNDVVSIGALGSGTLSVTAGGAFEGQVLQLGRNNATLTSTASYTGNGTMTVSGEGSSVTADQFYLGGGRSGYDAGNPSLYAAIGDGNGTATFANGANGTFETLRAFATDGTVGGNPVVTKGTLIIDNATVTVSGAATFDSRSGLKLDLNSPSQDLALSVGGLLTISGANLEVTLQDGFSAAAGESFSLISYSTLAGTFDGFENQSTFTVGSYQFKIDYALNGGNVIGLVVVPEPQTNLMIGAGLALVGLGIWRRGRRSNASQA